MHSSKDLSIPNKTAEIRTIKRLLMTRGICCNPAKPGAFFCCCLCVCVCVCVLETNTNRRVVTLR